MRELEKICQWVAQCLEDGGVPAVCAWGPEDKKRREGAVAAVSLRGCEGTPSGFQDYLGERYDPESGRWQEVYGRRAKLTFGLDLYAAGRDGAGQCQQAFETMAEVLRSGGELGLSLESLSREETEFDEKLGVFRCPVLAVCGAYLYAVTDESGEFLEFEVRGGRKHE